MRILVCGGRDFVDYERLERVLDASGATLIIHGGARGADSLAGAWAKKRNVPVLVFYADWSVGRKAGILRNQKMLDEGKPDKVIAFPGGRGTADMVRRAKGLVEHG